MDRHNGQIMEKIWRILLLKMVGKPTQMSSFLARSMGMNFNKKAEKGDLIRFLKNPPVKNIP